MVAVSIPAHKETFDFIAFSLCENDDNRESHRSLAWSRGETNPSILFHGVVMRGTAWPVSGKKRPGLLFGRGQGSRPPERRPTYWEATRHPFASLLVVAPMAALYEGGVLWLGGPAADQLRTGADAWMRQALQGLGFDDHGILPILLALVLLVWQVVAYRNSRVSPSIVMGMLLESLVWAVLLVAASRLLERGFAYLDQAWSPLLALAAKDGPSAREIMAYVGAGLYEETLFRLILVPLIYQALRLAHTPAAIASAFAVVAAGLLFALAHHAGAPAEPFTWFAFIFRWMAGVYFAWLFILRGFGVAAAAHAGYDILVSLAF